jgi:peptidylprolyl isomerase
MKKVESGSFVSVEYKGTLSNGEVFDSSRQNRPFEVEIGSGRVIKGFEEALMGMSLHEKKTFTVGPKDAYGERDESLKKSFSKEDVPPGTDPQVGQTVTLTSPQGQEIPGWISRVDDEKITVDLNHPLAGESLTFEVEVVGINSEASAGQGCGAGCDCSSGCS